MTDIRMKQFGGMRSINKVVFIDRARSITIEGSSKEVYKRCHNQKVDHTCLAIENGDSVEILVGKLDERSF